MTYLTFSFLIGMGMVLLVGTASAIDGIITTIRNNREIKKLKEDKNVST